MLLLGTYHFANPGLDVVKTDVADVLLSPGKQAEISAIVDALGRFQPTRIAVEQTAGAASWLGADLLSKWYERNIRIFANLQRITRPGDRVLVLFGSGHAPILRELIQHDPRLRLVEPRDYLPP